MRRIMGAVGLLALAVFLIRAAAVGLAGDYVDPITKISAQDEALYAHSAIRMAQRGDWLTPMFLGRYALYKPPLLMWAAGISARLLGVSRIALRLPVALAVSLAVCFVFLWAAELRSWQAGACAAVLLLSSHLWQVMGSLCMTDGLMVAFCTAALFFLFSDPWLESRWSWWGFSASVACAILTKSVAGALPLAVLGLYWMVAPPKHRPRLSRVVLVSGLALALAAPWFLYQMAVHGRWFWMEHVRVEILGFGAGQPPQTSEENHAIFYLMRMALLDPVLAAAAVAAAPRLFTALRRRSAEAVLLTCWLVVIAASMLLWQYRNIAYLLPVLPPLAIVAAAYGPIPGRPLLSYAGVALALKLALPAMPWGLSFQSGTVQPVAPSLSEYCERARGNELLVLNIDDNLYAAALPLPKLRYGLMEHGPAEGSYAMPFQTMGIIVNTGQFNDLARWEPLYRERLRQWGLDSPEPIASLIQIDSPADLARLVDAHPATDFLLPDRYRSTVDALAQTTHELVPAAPGHFFLLARDLLPRSAPPAWTCRL